MKIRAELGNRGGGVLDGADDVHQVFWPGFVARGGGGDWQLHSGMGIALFGGNSGAVRVPGVAGFHSVEDFLDIRAVGCPWVGDFICHLGVDFWAIGADGCPKAGDFICHLGVS